MAKLKRQPEAISGAFAAFPWAVIDSNAHTGASERARAFLIILIRQLNGRNNGHLQTGKKWLAVQGWKSNDAVQKACAELIERGLITQTKFGGLNAGANLFAVTWLQITDFTGLDITARGHRIGAWAMCDLPPTPRRSPPKKRDEHPVGRDNAGPTIGTVNMLSAPYSGSKIAYLRPLPVPYTGNNVVTNTLFIKHRKTQKRIVGKVGRSGIPQERHCYQAQVGLSPDKTGRKQDDL